MSDEKTCEWCKHLWIKGDSYYACSYGGDPATRVGLAFMTHVSLDHTCDLFEAGENFLDLTSPRSHRAEEQA